MSTTGEGKLLSDIITTLLYASIVPGSLFTLYLNDIILYSTLKLLLLAFFVVFVIGPLVFKYSYSLQRNAIFLNYVNIPKNPNYSNPSLYGLDGALNFYVNTNENIKLGVWHILPEELANAAETKDEKFYEDALSKSQKVVLYNHGNSGSRVSPHRVELYSVLRRYFHVITYDYRSYGDSSFVYPTEEGLVTDAKFMFEWIRNRTAANIFVWGHSLGTAVSTGLLYQLASDNINPTGLILESPFNNMRDEISHHPLTRPFRHLPWFLFTVVNPMERNNFKFENDRQILGINCPILILHAQDDLVVPHVLGHKLYKVALQHRSEGQGSVEFRTFDGTFGYGHKYICRAPELPTIIENFIVKAMQEYIALDLFETS